MLYTNLKHLESAADLTKTISENENVMVICGRMDAECIPVYRIAEELGSEYRHVKFYDMEYDNPESFVIRSMPEIKESNSLPFIVWYKNEKAVKITSGKQDKEQIIAVLDKVFAPLVRRMVCQSDF